MQRAGHPTHNQATVTQASPLSERFLDELGYNDSDGDEVPVGHEEEARKGAAACPEAAVSFATT